MVFIFDSTQRAAETRVLSKYQRAHRQSPTGRESVGGHLRPRKWAQLSISHTSSVARLAWDPGTANGVLALCTGSSMMKETCGALILNNFVVWVWQLLCPLENKHRNDPMLGFAPWERKKGRPEGICKGSHPHFVPLCPGQAVSPHRPSADLLADPVRNAGRAAWPGACSSRTQMPWVTGEFETWAESNVPVCSYSLGSAGAQAAHSTCQWRSVQGLPCITPQEGVSCASQFVLDPWLFLRCQRAYFHAQLLSAELYIYSAQSTAAMKNLCFPVL